MTNNSVIDLITACAELVPNQLIPLLLVINVNNFFLGTNPRTFEGLCAILENDREECLVHNVTRKFLNVQWRGKGYKLYMLNLIIYLIFHISFNVYALMFPRHHAPFEGEVQILLFINFTHTYDAV